MQIYLVVTPQEYREAAGPGRSFAHAAYRIGTESSLLRRQLLVQTRGGILTVTDHEAPPLPNPESLAEAVLRECGRRHYEGSLLDFEAPYRQDLAQLVRMLSKKIGGLYVPERYAADAPGAAALICTAISGGSFSQYLQDCMRKYRGRIALDVQRLRMDFTLPAKTGTGNLLTARQLQSLMQQECPAVFFSPDLCARYFTYIRDGQAHFVLFDDADTLKRKLRFGASLGISSAFLLWSEVQDLSGTLFC